MKNHHIITLIALGFVVVWLVFSSIFRNGSEHIEAGQEVTSVYLPDSSLVVLNKNAEITFRRKFKKRRIQVKGQAHIELTQSSLFTYYLEDDDLNIELDGNTFYIFNNEQQGVFHLLPIDGSARVDVKKASGQSRITVDEGYQMEYNATSKVLQTYEITDQNYLAWKTGKIIFDNHSISEVMNTLEELYHIPFKVNHPNLKNCIISGQFPSDSLEAVLSGISQEYEIDFEKTIKSYVIVGQGCAFADEY